MCLVINILILQAGPHVLLDSLVLVPVPVLTVRPLVVAILRLLLLALPLGQEVESVAVVGVSCLEVGNHF